jgi:hydroxymethylglutaryl-CoA lyase
LPRGGNDATMAAMTLPEAIRITEVGPRDGLQNEPVLLTAEIKTALIDALSACGFAEIEATSFVSPTWVPQLGDADIVMARIARRPGVIYSALVPNMEGLHRALEARADKIAVFTAASETFSRRNTNAAIATTLERLAPVVAAARSAGLPVRGYISCVIECPYEGPVEPARVREVAARLLELGVDEIDLGDTIGVAAPSDIERLYDELDNLLEPGRTTLHLHDTRGTALACALRAMQLGVRSFDASCTGLGGCPFAPGAAGNLATEDLVYMASRMGCETGVDLTRLLAAGRLITGALGRPARGRVFSAMAERPM